MDFMDGAVGVGICDVVVDEESFVVLETIVVEMLFVVVVMAELLGLVVVDDERFEVFMVLSVELDFAVLFDKLTNIL